MRRQTEGQSATPSTSPSVPASAIADHELLGLIGQGAYGEVWLARNALGAQRAVKIVHRHSFEHDRPFEREFNGIQKFEPISRSHEGFVDLLQVGRNNADGFFYYVMELADDAEAPGATTREAAGQSRPQESRAGPKSEEKSGGQVARPPLNPGYTPHTLKQELQRRGRLPLEECIQLGLSLTDALAYLHGQGLVHRDIKPSNIIFVGGVPKLADVGLVAGVGEARSYVGTEGFIPPEGPGTPQADLYSLGIVLYQLSTGKSHQEFPEPLSDLDSQPDHARWLELNAIIHKACAADPRDRYRSAEEMRAELAMLQGGQSVRHRRAVKRRWALARVLGLAVTTVGLLGAVFVSLRGWKSEHTPNPEALALYKEGQWQYSQLTTEAHIKALAKLSAAAEKDPKFIKPYAELTALYTWNNLPGITNEQIRLQKVKEIADKAQAINPDAPETHVALSWCRFLERDWRSAEAEIQRAIRLNPNLALAHDFYCFYLSMQGRSGEAHREGKRATEAESPDSQRASAIIASWPYTTERRFDLATAQLQRVLELDPNFAWGHVCLGDCYEAQSNYLAAVKEYRTAFLLTAKDTAKVNAVFDALREACNTSGEQGYLRKWIELILSDEALPEKDKLLTEIDHAGLAGFYARLGEKEKALDDLENHFDEPQVWWQIKFLPMYDPLHDEPRFKALFKRAGLEP